jgi:hypothetical protein
MTVALARRFKVDVSADNSTWVPLKGIQDFSNQEKATLQSTDNYDTNGYGSSEKTLTTWSATIKVERLNTSGVFDPGQELVRAARFQFGAAARVYIRWYDRNNAPEAYSGYAIVDWNPTKTGTADFEEITISLTGDGQLLSITNPVTTSTAPVVTSATPSGAGTGAQVQIQGAYFTGTVVSTGVKFGGTAATSWTVVSDSMIVAILPTGSAGSAPITVTNATGTSNALAYTRGS